ncbi:HNH endonuclease [Candidatus Woesearchaeota archaeon]|jgi:hypothetical protein|nr:HNH endonuclease [Candidatus Woesearchaeota archaeon]
MAKNKELNIILIVIGVIVIIISGIISLLKTFAGPIVIVLAILVGLFLIFKIYEHIYFSSEKFKNIKQSIQTHIDDCNELNHHIEELKGSYVNIKSYDYGEGLMKDASNHNFKRKEWSSEVKNTQVHNCSASVCKNAGNQPLKYMCKYFDIKKTDESLTQFETVLNNFSAAEEGKTLLLNQRDSSLSNIKNSIPGIINTFSKNRLIKELGFEEIDLSDLYFPTYTFQYVSAGGNSSMKYDIKLNIENLNKLVIYLKDLIKYKKSVVGQRALMTSKLREKIKIRDHYTCKLCNLSTNDEKNLLLEIDHIHPVSKGGITAEDNLQTLCWRCNRSKGAKVSAS